MSLFVQFLLRLTFGLRTGHGHHVAQAGLQWLLPKSSLRDPWPLCAGGIALLERTLQGVFCGMLLLRQSCSYLGSVYWLFEKPRARQINAMARCGYSATRQQLELALADVSRVDQPSLASKFLQKYKLRWSLTETLPRLLGKYAEPRCRVDQS